MNSKLDKAVTAIFANLTLMAATLGVLAGLAISLLGLEGSGAEQIANYSMLLLLILFPLLLIGLIRTHSAYWIELRTQRKTECIGKLLGGSLFGCLVALSVHVFLVTGIALNLGGGIDSSTALMLGAAYNVINMLGLSVLTTVVGFVYLWITPAENL
jgi:uncharacterized membrane protein (DUF373 family)